MIPGPGRSPGEGNGNLLQYSCLENPKDRGAGQAKVHGVARVRHDLATKPPPAGLFNFPFDIFAGSFSVGGRVRSVLYRRFSSICDLYSIDSRRKSQGDSQNAFRHRQMSPGWVKPGVESGQTTPGENYPSKQKAKQQSGR